jgi:uncharacterized protein (TIGR03086 family)
MPKAPAEWGDDVRVLARALDQTGDLLDHVHPDQLSLATPCPDWDLAALVDHVVATPERFLTMMRGGQPDWSTTPEHVTEAWGPRFRVAADDLIHCWHQSAGEAPVPADWQGAELAVHTWDLATALGFPLSRLDPEVAERGLAFLRANLTPDNRGPVFDAEQAAPDDAAPYDRLAAFAGRRVG